MGFLQLRSKLLPRSLLGGNVVTTLKSFTVDGIVLVRNTNTFTVDGIVKLIGSLIFTVDGIVKTVSNLNIFTVDGIVLFRGTSLFTVDGIIFANNLLTFTADGVVKVLSNLNTFTADGIIVKISARNLTSGDDEDNNSTSITALISPSGNNLILLTVASETNISTDPNQPTVTGNGLTWVAVNSIVWDTTGETRRRITVFRAMGVSPSSGVITIDFGGQNQLAVSWNVDEFSGVDISGVNGASAIVQSNTYKDESGTETLHSVVLANFGHINNATFGAFSSGVRTWTAGTDFIILSTGIGGDHIDSISEFRNDNDISVDATVSPAGAVGGIAIEIKALSESNTFTVDGIVKTIITPSFTADGIIQVLSNLNTFTVDGIVKAATTNTFTVDGIIKVFSNLFVLTVDGIVFDVEAHTFSVDGIVKVLNNTNTFTIDGIVKIIITNTFTIDGIVLSQNTFIFTVDGIIKILGITQTFTVDGIVLQQFTNTFTTDGIVLASTENTFTVDGNIKVADNFNNTFTVDGLILSSTLNIFTADGIVQSLGTGLTFTVDGIIKNILSATFTIDIIVITKSRGGLGGSEEILFDTDSLKGYL